MSRFDRYWIGILTGLLFPALFVYVYIAQMDLVNPIETLRYGSGALLGMLLPVSVLPDMALLFVFYQLDVWRLAKGVVIGMIPYILGAIYFSF